MTNSEQEPTPQRQYPVFYEKFIPIAIGVIAVIIVVVLVFALGVALGLIGGT